MFKIPGKIPVFIFPFFWLLAAAIGWLNTLSFLGTAIWMGVIFLSVLIHEFGHALTAVAFGQRAYIELVGFGGVTQRRGSKLKLWQEFIIVFNGPLAGFALCGVAWICQRMLLEMQPNSLLTYAVTVAFYVNLFWTILNLLPVQPLDGGKLLTIILESIFGLRGAKISLFISLILAAAVGMFFFATQNFLAGALFFILAFESYRSWKNSLSLTDQDQNQILQHLMKEAEREIRNGHKEEALNKFQNIRDLSKEGVIYQTATESTAALLAEKGNVHAAYEILEPLNSKLSTDGLRLLHQLAYLQGHWKEAIALGDRAYQAFPNYEIALINALSYSILGNARPAIGWLQCAIREGVPNVKEVLAKKEFDAIRSDPLFQELVP